MGKKDYLTQSKISQYLIDDYIYNRELESSDTVIRNAELLVDNNLGVKIEGSDDVSFYRVVCRYKVASKFMCKYNKQLKKFKRKMKSNEFGGEFKTEDDDPDLIKLSSFGLEPGIYFAALQNKKDQNDYAIFIVKESPDDNYVFNYTLYILGYNYLKFKDKFFELVDKYEKIEQKRKVEGIEYSDRRPFKTVKFKSFDHMVFSNKEKIIDYVDNWVNNIPEYSKYSIIPKLSILLYGEPGTGKSTFTKALAKHLGIDTIMTVSPDYFSQDEEGRKKYIRTSKYEQFVLSLDDIDCVCNSREDDETNTNGQVLSSLLEFLDNPNSFYYKAKDDIYYQVSIVVATTNYYEKLDPAVKRHGRFDLQIEMEYFDRKEAEEMCKIYNMRLKDVFKEPITDDFKISPAYLQALCIENIDKELKRQED